MHVLGIESTAHTIGASVVSEKGIISNVNSVYIHPKGSGIHPREAAIHHSEEGPKVIKEALRNAGIDINDLDAIAISLGPGLGPCLRVGATLARYLSLKFSKPLVPVNHAVAHIEIARFACKASDPLVVYIAGGNTIISTLVDGRYRIFGETQDIAIGNAIDYFGRVIGVDYPELINVEKLAMEGKEIYELPLPVKGQDVSYSGLLTAALKLVKEGKKLEDVCLSFIEHVYATLCESVERALAYTGKKELLLTGGTARSLILKEKLKYVAQEHDASFAVVPAEYAGDNGAMIAYTGFLAFKSGVRINVEESYVKPMWRIDEVDIIWHTN
ncbi:MAG TPA: KEOPS complex N(6)-L-threonylcarbamoyladenine synthase Kae1 [Geobacterales bacterium]|nr:KEOPS complex N(6)-L-threonylcarbamoyladenine synthase Kae1 [Geobacterales bacterium]